MHFYVSSTAQENVGGMGTSALEMDEVEMWAEWEQALWKWTKLKCGRNGNKRSEKA